MTFKNTAMVFAGLAIAVGTLTTKVMESNAATKEKVEVKRALVTTMWFEVEIHPSAENPLIPKAEELDVVNDGNTIPICTAGSIICEVELDVSAILIANPTYQFDGKTVQELLDAGAKYTGGPLGEDPVYSYRN